MILLLAACLVNDDLYALRRAALRDDDGAGTFGFIASAAASGLPRCA